MSELSSIVETAPLSEVETVVVRLQDLSEFGMRDRVRTITHFLERHQEMEEQLADLSAGIRREAARLLADCQRQWTAEEIEKATGYGTNDG